MTAACTRAATMKLFSMGLVPTYFVLYAYNFLDCVTQSRFQASPFDFFFKPEQSNIIKINARLTRPSRSEEFLLGTNSEFHIPRA